ncbi:unnamed protein product [Heligmosomoides polygyrus]|uniref:Amidase domain-containing protein n=1 Tax=Heligmosomoides polygyrus TaxID=6339 RepID=A0A183FIX4_HELPZ|nr:unnamed protein product [Heligmosomoides polygyrus]
MHSARRPVHHQAALRETRPVKAQGADGWVSRRQSQCRDAAEAVAVRPTDGRRLHAAIRSARAIASINDALNVYTHLTPHSVFDYFARYSLEDVSSKGAAV